ncbi:uncharacterized protein LOC117643547 [Thrips palmi]|uniref:Uncharacterized protein LOC117643547 n=1 Tax=Thrips palmi TaxID=161013 RepID=A0A6P8YFA2_THRPL|nr:uncharacterized protein LOC117643547 [Thrips palmi]
MSDMADGGPKFNCQFCGFEGPFNTFYKHLVQFHRHVAVNLPCGVPGCDRVFSSESALRTHIRCFHAISVAKPLDDSSVPPNADGKFICTVPHCQKQVDSTAELMSHIKLHLSAGFKVKCPFPKCTKKYSVLSSFTGHVTRTHKNQKTLVPSCVPSSLPQEENDFLYEDSHVDNEDLYLTTHEANFKNDKQLWLDSFAQFYMRLEYEHLIPQETVQNICEEMKMVHDVNLDFISMRLKSRLSSEGLAAEKVDEILKDCLPSQSSKPLSTSYLRRQYYINNFLYVAPVPVKLPPPKKYPHLKRYFYYVPLKETLQACFKSKSMKINLEHEPSYDDVIRDFTDGTLFKENEFFKDNPKALRLILFQDAFEVVCAIGYAKKKYKILGIYVAIGNLPDYLRSRVKSFQLVALCKDRELDHTAVFGKIVKDLKDLETNGINVPGVGIVKAGLAFIAGDNLGSHAVGGFYQNFSKSRFFCRFCQVDRNIFTTHNGPFRTYELRTPANYAECLKGKKITTKKGVKFNSEFNKLSSFHVCKPGLAPCLAHDAFEGFIKYDAMLFIKHFVARGWFTIEELNAKIDSFPYSEIHRRDKPQPIQEDSDKLKGKAWCICNFILLFPLIAEEFIKDVDDPVWKCFLILIETVELLCSPEFHISFVPYIRDLFYEYIALRMQCFPHVPLRPKHHYSLHNYLYLLIFGPMLKSWTLRFESKHSFFCRAAKACKQFKNILFSLAVRHELHQAYVRTGSAKFAVLQFKKTREYLCESYSTEIQNAIRAAGLDFALNVCMKVIFKGTKFCKGQMIALEQSCYQVDLVFGRINFILLTPDEKLFFLVEVYKSQFKPHIRAYSLLFNTDPQYKCVSYDSLLSYYPLHNYVVHGQSYVKLKHALVSKSNNFAS